MRAFPYPSTGTLAAQARSRPLRRLMLKLQTWRHRRRRPAGRPRRFVDLRPFADRSYGGLAASDLPLVFVTRNDIHLVRAFLHHYRSLGVTRFLCVDDASSDGTREVLAEQPDVHLFVSSVRFKEAASGRRWRELLFDRYGRGRWYLSVDSDELLVFDRWESRGVRALIEHLEAKGISRCPTPMLDAYPSGPIRDMRFDGAVGELYRVAHLIDGDGYVLKRDNQGYSLKGGPRRRVFGAEPELIKYALLRVGADTELRRIHQPLPYAENDAPILAALMHYKFFPDFRERFQTIVDEGQHAGGAREYRQLIEEPVDFARLSLEYPGSIDVDSSEALCRAGFVGRF